MTGFISKTVSVSGNGRITGKIKFSSNSTVAAQGRDVENLQAADGETGLPSSSPVSAVTLY